MLSGLLDMEEGERLLPFVRMFYSQPWSYLFDDEVGETHTIRQREGGEQSDALTAGIEGDRKTIESLVSPHKLQRSTG